MWPYVRFDLALGAGSGLAAWVLVGLLGLDDVALPAALATVLGTAVSILLAVRVNTAYQRWWDASGNWAQIVGLSRTLVRVVVAVSESKSGVDREVVRAFQRDVAARQIAFAVALRTALQGPDGHHDRSAALAYLPVDEADRLRRSENLPGVLLHEQSRCIFAAYADGVLSGLDNFQMEVALAGLTQQQALVERTRMQPVPAVYDIFSRYLVHLFVLVFPFAVVATLPAQAWLVVPATLVVAFAFRMVERIGAVVERPFTGTRHDLPLTALTTIIERNLLELIGEPGRPAAPQPVGGYLA